jgi:NTE family protein
MIAFVFSGGGSRGAMEAGGVKALYERGIHPDIVVGSSAGAMNAAFLAIDSTADGVERLCGIWRGLRTRQVVPGTVLSKLWRLIRSKPSIVAGDALRAFVEKNVPADKQTFGQLSGTKLYITAANLQTSTLYLYGEDGRASIADAVMASSAFPGVFPPVQIGGWQYVDGGLILNVPISVAIDKGATEVYALDVAYTGGVYGPAKDLLTVLFRVVSVALHQDLLAELKYATQVPGVKVHHIIIRGVPEAGDFDFDHGREMVDAGYDAVRRYLLSVPPGGLEAYALPAAPAVEPAPPPPGAVVWTPPRP